jgi:uncharacterized membrane protein
MLDVAMLDCICRQLTTETKEKSIIMKPFSFKLNVLGVAIATLLATKGMKRKSLSKTGAMAAFVVGYFSIACGKQYTLIKIPHTRSYI